MEKYVGAHVPFSRISPMQTGAKLTRIGARAGAFFTRPPQSGTVRDLYAPEVVKEFVSAIADKKMIAHAGYIYNLSAGKEEHIARFILESRLAAQMGVAMVVHPGSCEDVSAGINRVAAAIDRACLETAIPRILVEIMGDAPVTKKGSATIGTSLEQLGAIIARVNDKSRVGICLDTCHMYVGGTNISNPLVFDSFMRKLDAVVGREYLGACHVNDTNEACGSYRDRHEAIGKGVIGMQAFRFMMNHPAFDGIPLVTETHLDSDKAMREEIALLNSLCGYGRE